VQIFSNALAFLFALGVIVFVHELGHYVAAKAFGVRVLTFSLGFGRKLWRFERGETEYRVSWIPLGGFVGFAGQDPDGFAAVREGARVVNALEALQDSLELGGSAEKLGARTDATVIPLRSG